MGCGWALKRIERRARSSRNVGGRHRDREIDRRERKKKEGGG